MAPVSGLPPPTPTSLQALTSYDPCKHLWDLLSAPTRTNSAHTHPAPLPGLLLSGPQACNLTHPPPPAPGHYLQVGPSPPPLRAVSLRPRRSPLLPHSANPKPDSSSPSPSASPGASSLFLLRPSNFPGLRHLPQPSLSAPPIAESEVGGKVWARFYHPQTPRPGPGLDAQAR